MPPYLNQVWSHKYDIWYIWFCSYFQLQLTLPHTYSLTHTHKQKLQKRSQNWEEMPEIHTVSRSTQASLTMKCKQSDLFFPVKYILHFTDPKHITPMTISFQERKKIHFPHPKACWDHLFQYCRSPNHSSSSCASPKWLTWPRSKEFNKTRWSFYIKNTVHMLDDAYPNFPSSLSHRALNQSKHL